MDTSLSGNRGHSTSNTNVTTVSLRENWRRVWSDRDRYDFSRLTVGERAARIGVYVAIAISFFVSLPIMYFMRDDQDDRSENSSSAVSVYRGRGGYAGAQGVMDGLLGYAPEDTGSVRADNDNVSEMDFYNQPMM